MIRILHVFHRMNMGGAESLILNIFRNIDRTEFQFDFMVHSNEKGLFDEEIIKLGGNICYMTNFSPLNIKKYKKAWNDFLNKNEYDFIHIHISYSAMIIAKLAKRRGLRTIVHSHCISAQGDLKSLKVKLKNVIVKMQQYNLKKFADFKLSCSIDAGKWLFGNSGVNDSNFMVISNGIVLDDYLFNEENKIEYRKLFEISNNAFVIGNVGRFSEQKNQLFLLDIFYEIKKTKNDSILMLVGGGEFEEKIKIKAKELKIENDVIFCGIRKDVPKILSAFDTFVFPSLREGFGISILEAQANGLSCFVSDVIPKAVDVTGNVMFIKANESAVFWSEQILKNNQRNGNSIEEIKSQGYDIIDVTNKLALIYKGETSC